MMKTTGKTFWFAGIIFFAAFAAACGSVKTTPAPSAGGSVSQYTPTPTNLSGIGLDTKTIDHASFYSNTSGNHTNKRDGSAIVCNDCHTVTAAQVCAQTGCHPFSDYATTNTSITNPKLAMRNFDHTANKTGEQCNACHQPSTLKVAGETPHISGFRGKGSLWPSIKDTAFHTTLAGTCLDCHDVNNLTTPFPTSNHPASTVTNCEFCHYYSVATVNGVQKGKWSGNHRQATTTCTGTGCHDAAKNHNVVAMQVSAQVFPSSYGCGTCHTSANTATYTTFSGAQGVNFHANLKGVCLDCHDIANVAVPSTHTVASGRTTGCEKCHWYKVKDAANNVGQWAGGHTNSTSGCNATGCHTKHYTGYDCIWCHTTAASTGYTTWSLSFSKRTHRSWDGRSCAACHSGGFGD